MVLLVYHKNNLILAKSFLSVLQYFLGKLQHMVLKFNNLIGNLAEKEDLVILLLRLVKPRFKLV